MASFLTAMPYIALWVSLSAGVILYNKFLLSTLGFAFPITLTMVISLGVYPLAYLCFKSLS
jgi:hypothetical protein